MGMTPVILVNEKDEPVGSADKMQVHKEGLLHRAFSIFIFNRKGEMLLQQRALNKYHSAGLWTNTCCSHPKPGEETLSSAVVRLKTEMGFATNLEKIFNFIYKTEFDNGLTEYEFDHVFAGEYDGAIEFNKEEILDYCFKDVSEIEQSLVTHPGKYTVWFRLTFPAVVNWRNEWYKMKVA